jgi:hypothetical protein
MIHAIHGASLLTCLPQAGLCLEQGSLQTAFFISVSVLLATIFRFQIKDKGSALEIYLYF